MNVAPRVLPGRILLRCFRRIPTQRLFDDRQFPVFREKPCRHDSPRCPRRDRHIDVDHGEVRQLRHLRALFR